MKANFDMHYGVCTLVDSETGVGLKWNVGEFAERETYIDPTSLVSEVEPALIDELTEYAKQNYDDLL